LTLNRNFRADSCWSVEVMNGATGLRLFSRVTTDLTAYSAPVRFATTASAACWFPISGVSSPRLNSRASKLGGFAAPRFTSMVQYSLLSKARISRSRSTIRRSATVCTRPAESPRRTLSHNSGEIL